ncbi:PIN domain-containing protein [Allonocardiopsis opalescens]|uniref:PIN domain-containing protein n=2 Tax=Allonocardiopsis opalescens TaxID=1144618 RepID=A0A2T0PSS2_9ACTN|nr:PIN domain-containing protein [Allonocardiopsis opalescens]
MSIPPTIVAAASEIRKDMEDLRSLVGLLPDDEYSVRLLVDTNTLIDKPDVGVYTGEIGKKYMVHFLPVVLREIDDLKRGGRNQDLRDAARKADRYLKGLRTNGDIRAGVRVAGDVYALFEHIEPKSDLLPTWLDLTVPDDRFVASSLLLQSGHPGSTVYVATSDINLQTKLAAVGLPFVEP